MPHFKMHLNLVYGSGFPLRAPDTYKGEYDFRMPDYKRIDIGFSIVLKKKGKRKSLQSVKLYQNSMDKFRSF